MFVNFYKLKEHCPEEASEDIKDIVNLSKKFFDGIDVYPNQELKEMRINVQESKDILFQIISRFLTFIASNLEESNDLREIGFKLKFEEDLGDVLGNLRNKEFGRIEKFIGISDILSFIGELRTVYVFIIYNPIIVANKYYQKDLQKYIKNIFKIIRVNAGILGSSKEKFGIRTSKTIIPRPASLIGGREEESKEENKEGSSEGVDVSPLDLEELNIGEEMEDESDTESSE